LIDATIVRWRILESNADLNQDVFEFDTQRSHLLPAKCFRIRRNWTIGRLPNEQEDQIHGSRFYTHLQRDAFDKISSGESMPEVMIKSKDVLLKEEGVLYNANYCIRTLPDNVSSLLTVSIAADLR
jgi:hypothetical protein